MTASATTDLHLAIAHHLLFLLLAGVLAFEISAVRSSMDREAILRVARVDAWYGILAVAIIVVGFSRAILAAKRLGLLLRQPVLLGETWRLRRGGSVINHAHSGVHSLAKGDIGQSHLRPGSAWNPQCQARPVRGSNSLCAHSCIRRGHGSELRFAVALAPI